MARIVSLAILTTLIIFLGITFFQIVAPFVLPLFLAGVTAVWCQPLNGYFLKRFRQRDRWAAAATTGSVVLILFLPLTIGIFSAAKQLYDFTAKKLDGESPTAFVQRVLPRHTSEAELQAKVRNIGEWALDKMQPLPPQDAPADVQSKAQAERQANLDQLDEMFSQASEDLGSHLQDVSLKSLGLAASGAGKTIGVLGALAGGLISLTMFLIALYYFLCDGSALLSATEKLIPVQVEYQRQLIHEFNRVVQAVVSATMLSAIAQGAATSLALYFAGFHHFFLLFVLATFASLIPIAGTWMVWGPCAVWLCMGTSPAYGMAIFLAVIGIAVIGTMDNVIKAYVLQNDTSLHPLLAFVSVFGGLQVMGLWGIFVGPIVACCLHALVKIFNTELAEFSRAKFAKQAVATDETNADSSPPASAEKTSSASHSVPTSAPVDLPAQPSVVALPKTPAT